MSFRVNPSSDSLHPFFVLYPFMFSIFRIFSHFPIFFRIFPYLLHFHSLFRTFSAFSDIFPYLLHFPSLFRTFSAFSRRHSVFQLLSDLWTSVPCFRIFRGTFRHDSLTNPTRAYLLVCWFLDTTSLPIIQSVDCRVLGQYLFRSAG